MKTFSMMILGCKVNDYEATYVKNELLKDYKYVEFKENADIIVIFSCCVTNTAESKTRKFIHHARKYNPDSYIVVVGCLSQIKPDLKEFNDVDLVIGSTKKDEIVSLIKEGAMSNEVEALNNPKFEELYLDNYPGKDRAFLKIQDGCNQFCSYCVIPYARGRERSANHITLLNQAKELSKSFKEIVLTGIHTGRYNDNCYKLYDLLKDLVQIEGLETIRLSSIEITEISDEIIELIKNNTKIARHLHIPVQSASDKILKLMNRPYTIKEYIDRVNYIRNELKDISISTDLIVGFPNEDDDTFKTTLDNLTKINFSFIHIFTYSRKSGTKADSMDGHINESVKKERSSIVKNLQKELSLKFYRTFIDKEVDVLIEKNDNGYSFGYSKQYFYVEIKGIYTVGSIVKVKIKSVDDKIIGDYVS